MSAQHSFGARVMRTLAASTVAVGTLAACGSSLVTRTTTAMDACIAVRNPLFTSGRGGVALDTPLPPAADSTANTLNYQRGFEMFKAIAESAEDQVTLVCALDLASRYGDSESTRFITRYLKHPSPDVATAAQILLDRRR